MNTLNRRLSEAELISVAAALSSGALKPEDFPLASAERFFETMQRLREVEARHLQPGSR